MIFSMDNGQGEIAAVYTPTVSHELCDGHWHTITGRLSAHCIVLIDNIGNALDEVSCSVMFVVQRVADMM